MTRSEIGSLLAIGRNPVQRRLETGLQTGLLIPTGHAASTGGRAPEIWTLNPSAASVLTICMAIRTSVVALTDLRGSVLTRKTIPVGFTSDAADACKELALCAQEMVAATSEFPSPCGIGVTVAAPVEPSTGRIVNALAGLNHDLDPWVKVPLRDYFSSALGLPAWIEDETKAMALASSTRPHAPRDILYVRLSLGLGLGIVSGGQVHRGNVGTSGELAHVEVEPSSRRRCRCGRRGCLETFISGIAFEQEARRREYSSTSPFLKRVLADQGEIYMEDVFRGIAEGDPACTRIATQGALRLAGALAVLTTTYGPGEIVIGGTATISGNFLASVVNQAIRRRVLPITARRLRVRMGERDRRDEIVGAARMVTEACLSPKLLAQWIERGGPPNRPYAQPD